MLMNMVVLGMKTTTFWAVRNGHLDCLIYAHEHGCLWHEITTARAAGNGHLKCLKYAHEQGCPWHEGTTSFAAANGNLDCLQYAHENGCPLHEDTTSTAARYGHLDCLKYAHEHGCPWGLRPLYYRFQMWKKYSLMNKIKEWKRNRLFKKKIIIFEDWKLSIKESKTLWIIHKMYFLGWKNYKNDDDFELLIKTTVKHQEIAIGLEQYIACIRKKT